MDMRFGMWNVSSLYRAGSLMTVSRELFRYSLDLVGVQNARWESSGMEPQAEYTLFMERGIRTTNWIQCLFVHKRIISAIKRVEFVIDRMSYY
jgi:hypothetical protein